MIKLNLGCGRDIKDGFVNIDINSKDPRVVLGDVSRLNYESGSVDEIYALDILEHFELKRVESVLAEWCRVLKPRGVLFIRTPDLDVIFSRFYTKAQSGEISYQRLSSIIHGGQKTDFDIHYVTFNFSWLKQLLAELGMEETIYVKVSNQNMVVKATKRAVVGGSKEEGLMNMNKEYWKSRYGRMGGKRTVGKSSWDDKTYQEFAEQFTSDVIKRWFVGKKFQKLLDFGCGIGRWRPGLEQYCDEYYGVDIIEDILQKNCSLMVNNRIPFAGQTFDVIFSAFVLQHVVDDALLDDYVKQFKNILVDGRSVFLVENTSGPDNDYMRRRNAQDYINIFREGGIPLESIGSFKGHSVLAGGCFCRL